MGVLITQLRLDRRSQSSAIKPERAVNELVLVAFEVSRSEVLRLRDARLGLGR